MPNSISTEMLVAMAALIAQGIAFVTAIVKGQQWVETLALKALSSERGRSAVMRMIRDHLDMKFDAMSTSLEGLSKTIDQMGTKIERRLDKLDSDMQSINVRVTLLEQKKKD